ncbi:MAG TPA: excinuclease ABC subunit UvrC [Candidatus Deferrimicrobium sp.]|nr:excinuclease ABC subunit UvrC [Candidatus Deferrimicrobium sp.]
MNQEIKAYIRDKIEELPDISGVYIFKDSDDRVLYIGKAKSIKNRVKSHFSTTTNVNTESFIVNNTEKIEFIVTDSEIEAFLLEAELIKLYNPKYNINLKDDKSFPYIIITQEDFPRIIVKRIRKETELKDFKRFFGPFTDVGAVKRTLNFLFRIFPVCSCENPRKKRIRPCLKYQLKRCSAPCVEKISREEYLKNLTNIELFLEGKKREIIEEFKRQMKAAAENLEFETATLLRDHIWALEKTIINQRIIDNEPEFSLGMKELKEILNLNEDPLRIEAFDISNLSGTDPTGSLVLFLKGQPNKNGYRRFKIRTVVGANDVAMMGEIIERRYKRLLKEKQLLPNLIIVDGGKPQLNVASEILSNLGLNEIPIIGLAKRYEHVFQPGLGDPIIISPDSPALFLLQRIRDEAHRFALKYHHLLRKKRTIQKKN